MTQILHPTQRDGVPATQTAAQPRALHYSKPPVHLQQTADGYTLEVELPGITKSSLELTVEDGQLTILGHRSADDESPKTVRYWHQERGPGNFKRVFDLDPAIDASSISASIEQGLLTIRLPKAEAHQPRKIEVK